MSRNSTICESATVRNRSLARCPECGRVFGFDVTAEELGLTAEQLQRAQAARMGRMENKS